MQDQLEGALTGYRVLDLSDIKGAYGTKLLADLGADVIKIESPTGDPTRNIPPFAHGVPHPERSLAFLFRNANKRGITLNLETVDGQSIFKRLVKNADVLVEAYPPGYMKSLGLDYLALKEINPELIMASITEFGQDGPYKNWKGSPIVDFALSGNMIEAGFPEKPPCNFPGMPAYDATSAMAAVSITLSLYHRGLTGSGQFIDTSVHQNARLALYPWGPTIHSYNTNPDSPPPPPESRMGAAVFPVYPCKDGFVRVTAMTPWQWDALLRVIGEPEVLCQPEWRDFLYRIANGAELYKIMIEFTMQYAITELFDAGHDEGAPIVPIYDITGFIASPHTQARGFFTDMDHPHIGQFSYPGPPYKWSETRCSIECSAPTLGQHNHEIYCEEMGISINELAALKQTGAV